MPTLRNRALLLANSSYALPSLHRPGDAKQRIDKAIAILKRTRDYPAERIQLDSPTFVVSRAEADDALESDDPRRAVGLYEQLLARVMAAKPTALDDLRDAPQLSQLYESLARLYRRIGETAKAESLEARREDLWRHWNQKLPNNRFILSQLRMPSSP